MKHNKYFPCQWQKAAQYLPNKTFLGGYTHGSLYSFPQQKYSKVGIFDQT